MEHCMHYTDYSRSGDNPPDAVATCCNCGLHAETKVFEMKELGDHHGDRVATELVMTMDGDDNPVGGGCGGK